MRTFDDVIEEKLSIGLYQVIVFVLLSMIDLADGAQIAMTSITLPAIQREFGLTSHSISFLSSIFFIGTAVGSFSVGKFADVYGRKRIIQLSLIFQIVNTLAFYSCSGFITLSILRFFYGFCFGFSLPLTTIYITEILPKQIRGKWVVLINLFATIGNVYGILMAYFIMDNIEEGNWRWLLACTALLPFITLIGTFIYLRESMRFFLIGKQFSQLRSVFNEIVDFNNRHRVFKNQIVSRKIDENDINQLEKWVQKNIDSSHVASYSILFRGDWFKITLMCWIMWFGLNFMFYGQISLLPYLFKSSHTGIGGILMSTIGEIPVTLVIYYMIEHPNFGRKHSVFIFALFAAGLIFLVIFSQGLFLLIVLFWTRFFMKGMFGILHPYTSEIYPTSFRSVGYGFASAVGRFGSCIMPFVVFPCFFFKTWLPFCIFGFSGVVCAICALNLPFDTTGRSLDISKPLNETEMIEL